MASVFINGFQAGMRVIEEIEDAISFNISKLMSEGPIEELTKTENAQPAIFATGMACVAILEREYGYELSKTAKYLAGHSLGEYTALCTAGAFSITDAARLVRIRGELMTSACPDCENYSMVALLGVGAEVIEELVERYQSGRHICVIANDNSASQVVISGHKRVVMAVCEAAKHRGVVKAIELNTSGPFHSPLMSQAAIEFDKVLLSIDNYYDCKIPVVMNSTAFPLIQKDDIYNHLIMQMTGRVRWRQTIEFLMNDDEIDELVEIAPGRTLSTMIKRSYDGARVRNLETVAQIQEFAQ
jgi:[acyl-carrier-protein] S-malonyltransferase